MECSFDKLRLPRSIHQQAVATKQANADYRIGATVTAENSSRQYKILEEIDEGGFGCVYKATEVIESLEVGNQFAIKFSNSILGNNKNLIWEALNLARTRDRPNSVPLKDYGLYKGDSFIVLPYLKQTLHDYLEMTPNERRSASFPNAEARNVLLINAAREKLLLAKAEYDSSRRKLTHQQNALPQQIKSIETQVADFRRRFDRATANVERLGRDCAVTEKEALLIGKDLCEALVWLDANGTIHGDLKPKNIVNLSVQADRFTAGIIDFGIAQKSTSVNPFTIGTPKYSSPERLKSPPELDLKADVYSVGVILCEARRIKVESSEAKFAGVETTKAFRNLIDRCVCQSPSRFTSKEALQAIERMLVPRRSPQTAIVLSTLICLLIGVVYPFFMNRQEPTPPDVVDLEREYEKLIKNAGIAQESGRQVEMLKLLNEASAAKFKKYHDWELGYMMKRAIHRHTMVKREGIRQVAVSPNKNLIASVSINDEASPLQVEMFEASELLNNPMGKIKSVWTESIKNEGVVDLVWNRAGDRLALLTKNQLFVFEIAGSEYKRIIETQTAPRPISKARFIGGRIVAIDPGRSSVEIFDLGTKAWSQSDAVDEKLLEFVPCFGTDNTLDMAILGERGEFKLSGSRLEQIAPAVLFGPVESARENPDKKGTLVHRKGLSEFYSAGSLRSGTIPFDASPVSLHIGKYSTALVNITDYEPSEYAVPETIKSSRNSEIVATYSTVSDEYLPEGFSVGPTESDLVHIHTKNRFFSTVLSPDGLSVATVGPDDASVFALDANIRHDGSLSLASFKKFESPFNAVAWSHDGNLLVAAGRKTELVDSAQYSGNWSPIDLPSTDQNDPSVSVCFGRVNNTPILAVGGSNGSINFWEIQRENVSAKPRAILKKRLPERQELPSKIFFHDQNFIVRHEHPDDSEKNETTIVDCNSYSQKEALGKYDFDNAMTIAFSTDSKKVAYYKFGREFAVRNLEDQTSESFRVASLGQPKAFTVNALAFSPSSSRVFALISFRNSRAWSEDNPYVDLYNHVIVIFNQHTGEELFQISCPSKTHSMQMGDNGVLAVGWENGLVFHD